MYRSSDVNNALSGCSSDIYDVMTSCWSRDPNERPNGAAVLAKFQSIAAKNTLSRPNSRLKWLSLNEIRLRATRRIIDEDETLKQALQPVAAAAENSHEEINKFEKPRCMILWGREWHFFE